MTRPTRSYQRRVGRGLERALAAASTITIDLGDSQDRWLIVSDHHKGERDRSDDFAGAEQTYHAALGYYFEQGYKLALLGDVEEFWENRVEPVLETYQATFHLERAFYERGGYYRVWGNHDDEWRYPTQVMRHLDVFFPGIGVEESFLLEIRAENKSLGKLMLVHGHQGTLFTDTLGWLTRLLARYLWRPFQRIFNINPNTPAKSLALRFKHDIAMFNWAVSKPNLVLISGHTHHPIFDPGLQVEQQALLLETARQANDDQATAHARARLEHLRVIENRQGFRMSQPSYFNTGCCCFADGDITGIELDQGLIKLVRWSNESYEPDVLASADLKIVLERVSTVGVEAVPLFD